MVFAIGSSAFVHGGRIPPLYTCEGNRFMSPPLSLTCAPEGTQSVAIIMEDPDVPRVLLPDGLFVHWVVFNIPAMPNTTVELTEGGSFGVLGVNTRGENTYTGPCPPTEFLPNEHRYFFYAHALNTVLELSVGATKQEVLTAMEGHVLVSAQLMGTYKKGVQ